jgi:hypothetical protein
MSREVLATCHGCGWRSSAANAWANAARHHDASGHPIDVAITTNVSYGGEVPAGQEAFDDVGEAAAA